MNAQKRIVKHSNFLLKLAKAKRANRRRLTLVKSATPEQLLSIVEICLNLLRSRLPLTQPQRRQLARHADAIRRLSRARSANSARRILQTGGNPALIASLLANLVVPLIGEAINKFL